MSLHKVHVSNILPSQEQGVYNVYSHHLLLGLTLTLHLPNQLDIIILLIITFFTFYIYILIQGAEKLRRGKGFVFKFKK